MVHAEIFSERAPMSGRALLAPPRSVLGEDAVVRGRLEARGAFEIRGLVDGALAVDDLLVAPSAEIDGEISGEVLVIAGRLRGVIRGGSVAILASARIDGEVYYDRISIEPGADVEAVFRSNAFLR